MILGQPVTLKATYGIRLRKEDGQFLAEDGETVIATSYWLRRLENGDVDEIVATKVAPTATAKG